MGRAFRYSLSGFATETDDEAEANVESDVVASPNRSGGAAAIDLDVGVGASTSRIEAFGVFAEAVP